MAARYKPNTDIKSRNKEVISKELEYTYINLFIEETKLIFNDSKFQKKILKVCTIH